MRSTRNQRAIIVGVIIAIGICIFMAGVFTLGGEKKSFTKSISLNAVFADVNGLQKGNNVWFAGVKVGTVHSVTFDSSARVIVEMRVDEKITRLIHSNAHAKIGTEGLIGNKIVVIYGGSPDAPQVADGTTLGVEQSMNTEAMLDTLQKNNRNLLAITNNFRIISEQIATGQGTVGKLVNNDAMANSLQSSLNMLQHASGSAQVLTNNLAAYTAQMRRPGSLANDLVNDTTIVPRLRSSATQIQAAAANAKSFTDNINNANSPVGVLMNDPQAAADLKATLSNLNQGTAKLDTNMEAMRHNIFLRGFFKKKAKREAKAARDAQK